MSDYRIRNAKTGWAARDCPTCGAKAGEICWDSDGFCHQARLGVPKLGRSNLNYIAKPTYLIRGEGSGSCRARKHNQCSGRFHMGHGLGLKSCGCMCHRAKAAAA